VFSVEQYRLPVDKNVNHARGKLVRLGKRRVIANAGGIKHHNVSKVVNPQLPAPA
jgi:hypothetical protein